MVGGRPLGGTRTVEKVFLRLFGEKRKIDYPTKGQLILVTLVLPKVRLIISVFFISLFMAYPRPGGL